MADARCWLNSPNLANKEQWLKTDHIRRSDRMIDGQVVIGYNPNIGGTVSMSPVEWAAQEKARQLTVQQVIVEQQNRYVEQMRVLNELIVHAIAKAQATKTGIVTDDPDGPLVPMKPAHPLPERTISAPQHDFIAALYRPYSPVV